MSNTKKYKVSFRYSNSQCPSETNEGLSAINSTSRLSYATFNSAYSASSKRINQLQPKTKMELKSKPKTIEKKRERSSKDEENKPNPIESLQSMNYNSIKPTIAWKKYTILCGFERGLGESGCQCS